MSVTRVNFGKDQRDTAKAFARLMDMCEKRSEDILARPEHYLVQAYEEIYRLRALIESAQEALIPPITEYFGPEEPAKYTLDTIVVVKSEYDRLLKCAKIVGGEP